MVGVTVVAGPRHGRRPRYHSNIDTYEILSLLSECNAEDCMDAPSRFNMREFYVLKSQIHDPDSPTYMEALSGEHANEYFKAMDD